MADRERCLLGDGVKPDSTVSEYKKRRTRNKKLPDLKTGLTRTQTRMLERRTAKEGKQAPRVSVVEQVRCFGLPM